MSIVRIVSGSPCYRDPKNSALRSVIINNTNQPMSCNLLPLKKIVVNTSKNARDMMF